jgi:ADP-heptose:LPS heptosyltransferase
VQLSSIVRLVIDRLPLHAGAGVGRRLSRQGDAARDARRYPVAAALYEEALRFAPGSRGLHIQAGHMFKESGDFGAAELHYLAARKLGPDTADFALQWGHFCKVAGRPDEAEAAYRRALELRPGWTVARQELARMQASSEADEALPQGGGDARDLIVPELLPLAAAQSELTVTDTIQIRRLGARRVRSRWGDLKALRGVEAIRGFCIASVDIVGVDVLLAGEVVARGGVQSHPWGGGKTKYVFNIWHDFTTVEPGRYAVEVRFREASGRSRSARDHVLVAPPEPVSAYRGADALIPPLAPGDIEAQINDAASVVRGVERPILDRPVRTILVQRVDQLGDLVCSVPALRRLSELFPDAKLVGLVTPANEGFARTLGLFTEIVVANVVNSPSEGRRLISAEDQEALRARLAAYDFDIAIDLGEGSDSRPVLLLSGARFLYGFKDREWSWLSAGLELNAHDPINSIEVLPPSRKILALVESLGVLLRDSARPLPNPDADRAHVAAYGVADGERYAVLHSGARISFYRWPGYAELASLIAQRTDMKVVLFSDDPEHATRFAQDDRVRVVPGLIPFEAFDALVSHCTVFVGNDSGPKHLASLRGAQVVSVHCARLNWSEWGQEISGLIISRRVPCAGCAIPEDGSECGRNFACIRQIDPEEVFDAVTRVLPVAA